MEQRTVVSHSQPHGDTGQSRESLSHSMEQETATVSHMQPQPDTQDSRVKPVSHSMEQRTVPSVTDSHVCQQHGAENNRVSHTQAQCETAESVTVDYSSAQFTSQKISRDMTDHASPYSQNWSPAAIKHKQ